MPLAIVRLTVRRLGPASSPGIFVLKFTRWYFLTGLVSLALPLFDTTGAPGRRAHRHIRTRSRKRVRAHGGIISDAQILGHFAHR